MTGGMSGEYVSIHFDLAGEGITCTYTDCSGGNTERFVQRFGKAWTVRDIFHQQIETMAYLHWIPKPPEKT